MTFWRRTIAARWVWFGIVVVLLAAYACAGDDDADDDADDDDADDDDADDDDDDDDDAGDDDAGDDDDAVDECAGNVPPILDGAYLIVNDGRPDDSDQVTILATDELFVWFDYMDADCNLDYGWILVDFHDGTGFQEEQEISDAECGDLHNGIFGYYVDVPALGLGDHPLGFKLRDRCDADSAGIEVRVIVVES